MVAARRFPSPVDLHTHSQASDGTENPADLVRAASDAGLGTMALTDHDTTAGWEEAARAARATGIVLVPGMELSTRYGRRSVHVLGYLFDPSHEQLVAELCRVRQARRERAEAMVERLAADYPLTWDDILAQAPFGAVVGRPHIADALVERGHARSRDDAFATLLHPRAGYYEPLYAPTPLEGVRLIRDAGGVPVLAHPATRGPGPVIDRESLEELVEAGLAGLEVEHRENTEDGKRFLRAFAVAHGLLMTGSSDYHGDGKVNRLGEKATDPAVLGAIAAEATGSAVVG